MWTKLDDGFWRHPKIAGLSYRAYHLHVQAMNFAEDQLTDGRITLAQVRMLDATHGNGDRLGRQHAHSNQHSGSTAAVTALVSAGLWERVGEDYQIHDFLKYNPSRAKVLADRELDRLRKASYRESRRTPTRTYPPVQAARPDPLTTDYGVDSSSGSQRARFAGPAGSRAPTTTVTDGAGRVYLTPDQLDQRAGIPLHPPDTPPAPTEPPDPPLDAPLW